MRNFNPFLLLVLIMFITGTLRAQDIFEWGVPVPVTDSVTFNSHPSHYQDYNNTRIFYEKAACDGCTPSIWMRNLSTMEPEVLLISNSGGCYEPRFAEVWSNNYRGFLLYLSDSTGSRELFATRLGSDFEVLETTQLTYNGDEESQLRCTVETPNVVSWITGGTAMTATLMATDQTCFLENTEVIDTDHVVTAFAFERFRFWMTNLSGTQTIWFSRKVYNNNTQQWEWTEAAIADSGTDISDLNASGGWLWSETIDPVYMKNNRIMGYDVYSGEPYLLMDDTAEQKGHPAQVLWDYAVRYPGQPGMVAFTVDTAVNSEIAAFIFDFGSEDTTHLTSDNLADINPELFWGEPTEPLSNWVYAVWQSMRNGQSVLYTSKIKAFIGSGIEESQASGLQLSCSPNPVTVTTTITVESIAAEELSLQIVDLTGKQWWTQSVAVQPHEPVTVQWTPAPQISQGVYLLEVTGQSAGRRITQKIVRR